MKKEMEDPEKIIKTKKAITVVKFMSKESYRKDWEGVKLTAENEMLFYIPRTMEK